MHSIFARRNTGIYTRHTAYVYLERRSKTKIRRTFLFEKRAGIFGNFRIMRLTCDVWARLANTEDFQKTVIMCNFLFCFAPGFGSWFIWFVIWIFIKKNRFIKQWPKACETWVFDLYGHCVLGRKNYESICYRNKIWLV